MPSLSTPYRQHILLADDDKDDCLLFKDALEELPLSLQLTTVPNGEQLMQMLSQPNKLLPDILFLDLNMPRKNGFQCLKEIRQNEKLRHLPIIIVSTSFEQEVVNQLYDQGAQHYIRKPNEFSKLKELLHQAILIISQQTPGKSGGNFAQTPKENFIL